MAKTEILIEDPSLDYELDEEDIPIYAKQIGIDIENEKHLMWIAEEGLAANVPEPWLILSDEKGRIFYSNFETGEKSWVHPLDKEYAALVIQERRKFLRSPLSDCGFESKLSSLSDAPPLSSSDKTTPSSLKPTNNTNTLSGGKLELGHFENRRGTKLAPVRLNTLKMPVPSASPKSSTGMSFMPKGSSLSRNIRRANEEAPQQNESPLGAIRTRITPPQEDFNEDLNSEDESKYSYEETDEDMEKSYDQSDGGSYFSPPHSTIESPEALDINSLVQLGTKPAPRFNAVKRGPKLQSVNEDPSPTLGLRKTGQSSLLKPLQHKKKATPKKFKKAKKIDDLSDFNDTEDDFDSRIAALNEEQRLRFESIQKEWAAMLEELEKQEKAKYDKMVDESNKRFEHEKAIISKETNEKLSELKMELKKKVEEEENSGQVNLAEMKKANEQKFIEEEQKFKEKFNSLTDNLKSEVEKMEQKNTLEISEKKKHLDEENEKEIEEMKSLQQEHIKKLEESYANEIAMLEETHKNKIAQLQDSFSKEQDAVKSSIKDDNSSSVDEIKSELQKVQELFKDENEKYQQLSLELKKLKEEIAAEREVMKKLEEKTASAQTYYEEIQDDVDKTENELDLLRNEKSALISELNVLKDNIKEEKLNLLKEKDSVTSPNKKPNCLQKAVNTDVSSVFTQATQTNVETRNISCQIKESVSKLDKDCQVYFERKLETSNSSCQVELLQTGEHRNETKVNEVKSDFISAKLDEGFSKVDANTMPKNASFDNMNLEVLVNKVMENALMGISSKIEGRLKLIEEQLSSVKKESNPTDQQTSSLNILDKNITTEMKSISHTVPQNVCNSNINSAQGNTSLLRTALPCSSSCSCGMGDAGSCQIMQDVKNSIYRLNDILSSSYEPSLGSTVISDFNFPINNHSNSLQSFYTQFRQLQEKQRITELKHKLQNGNAGQHSRSLNALDQSYSANFTRKETPQFNNLLNANSLSLNSGDDPITRARNLVLREQARSWKQQQQYLNSSDINGFPPLERNYTPSISDNISPSVSSRISPGLSENSSTAHFPFLKFEPDPETEYNEWMSRLKTLQDKIRSHRII
ncbi:centrosomal protein of 164 kDa-like isoform X2 [Argiope bruennichi]|uniref:centrosomal protein of 164 kDa-like isoform X2 n=1 Tax=Argiope bruennichi TaxID=94029 RepID=UPI0024953290|nr:centrosomal protein of 164 kDa-like isoform X2 [Argiope bruennichi]